MRKLLRERGVKFADSKAPIIALFTYEQEITLTICKRLFEEGVYANPVLPPATPPGQCLIRTTYTATHTEKELEEAADIIITCLTYLKSIKCKNIENLLRAKIEFNSKRND